MFNSIYRVSFTDRETIKFSVFVSMHAFLTLYFLDFIYKTYTRVGSKTSLLCPNVIRGRGTVGIHRLTWVHNRCLWVLFLSLASVIPLLSMPMASVPTPTPSSQLLLFRFHLRNSYSSYSCSSLVELTYGVRESTRLQVIS